MNNQKVKLRTEKKRRKTKVKQTSVNKNNKQKYYRQAERQTLTLL